MNEKTVTPEARASVKDVEQAGVLAGRTFVQVFLTTLLLVTPTLVALDVSTWKVLAGQLVLPAFAAGISRGQSYLRGRWGNA